MKVIKPLAAPAFQVLSLVRTSEKKNGTREKKNREAPPARFKVKSDKSDKRDKMRVLK